MLYKALITLDLIEVTPEQRVTFYDALEKDTFVKEQTETTWSKCFQLPQAPLNDANTYFANEAMIGIYAAAHAAAIKPSQLVTEVNIQTELTKVERLASLINTYGLAPHLKRKLSNDARNEIRLDYIRRNTL